MDAAWGGYFRSIFKGSNVNGKNGVTEKVREPTGGRIHTIAWDDADVHKAFISMEKADSITTDPHKMGYVPYPAGLIAFRNAFVTDLVKHRAQYISSAKEGVTSIDRPPAPEEVGPYIIEGSKPGFVALGCWLAHKTIPLTIMGHGKLIKTAVLNAKKLYFYLSQHAKAFNKIEKELGLSSGDENACHKPFTFVPLNDPDTNIICFIAVPRNWRNGKLDAVDYTLKELNDLNETLHKRLDIPGKKRGKAMPYSIECFVSKTIFAQQQYSYESLSPILSPLRIKQRDYEKHGLIVLRSTVMNPLYYRAQEQGLDYLWKFVTILHQASREIREPRQESNK